MLKSFFFLLLFSLPAIGTELEIPRFTPNVVDATGRLSTDEVNEINGMLLRIRRTSDIWGAVYLLEDLGDEPIEALAQRVFKKWKLGAAKKDNGLLLILAMKNRQSRFEVGYGLEGDLPDAIARRALDNILRPNMRTGDTKKAILDSFEYLAAVKTKDPSLRAKEKKLLKSSESQNFADRGSIPAFIFYLFCLWLLRPLTASLALWFAQRLSRTHSAFQLEKEKKVNFGRFSLRYLLVGDLGWVALFLRAFASLNPGAFVFLGSGASPYAPAVIMLLCTLVAFLYFRAFAGRYWSATTYQKYLARLRKKNEKLIAKGYMRESSPGQYEFTASYYSSAEYRASRSSSSGSSRSSSSSSSSSGGGRSGGGGASSSW